MGRTPNLILIGARSAFAVAVAATAAAPFLFGPLHLVLLTEFMSMLVLAVMWNLLAGYADIVTVGQHAFVGVGAYAFFGFATLWEINGRGRLDISVSSSGQREAAKTLFDGGGSWRQTNDILHADSEAEMYRLLSPLTEMETKKVARLVEMAATGLSANVQKTVPKLS